MHAVGIGISLKFGLDIRELRRDLHVVDDGTHIQTGATNHDWDLSSAADVGSDPVNVDHELRHGVRIPWIENVDEMMRHGCLLIARRLGGADIHTSVDLHGVGRNQFDAIIDGSDCHGER